MKIGTYGIAKCIIFNGFGITKDSIRSNMKLWHMKQFYAAEDSGTGIPTGIRLHTWGYSDSYTVLLSKIEIRCNIYGKWNIAVVLQNCLTSIDVDRSIHHNPVKMQIDCFLFPFLRDVD